MKKLTWKNRVLNTKYFDQQNSNNSDINAASHLKGVVETGAQDALEKSKVDIPRRNYMEVEIDLDAKVDETFGYEGYAIAYAKFEILAEEVMSMSKRKRQSSMASSPKVNHNKTENVLIKHVVIEKLTSKPEENEKPDLEIDVSLVDLGTRDLINLK